MHTTDTSWLRVKEVAFLLGVSPAMVRRHVKTGDIPSKQLGERGSILVPRRFLEPDNDEKEES